MTFAALTFDRISAVELVRMWEHCVRTWSGPGMCMYTSYVLYVST